MGIRDALRSWFHKSGPSGDDNGSHGSDDDNHRPKQPDSFNQSSLDGHAIRRGPGNNASPQYPSARSGDSAGANMGKTTVAMPADTPPALLQGYDVLQRLGSGGESDVWLARDRVLRRKVVVKRMAFACELEQMRRDNALNAIADAGLKGVPQIYAAYKSPPTLWLVLEHIPGRVLADFRPHTVDSGLGIGQILCLAIDMIQALNDLHRGGWIHGDISPANVVVDASGYARLIDFGQAGHLGDRPRGRGVPGFSRPADVPDQVMTEHDDTYALGALLFWLLCGQTPTQIRAANGQVTTIAPWIDDLSSPTHELLWATAQALIEPNRQRRPSLAQLVHSLHRDERKLPDGSRANLGRLVAKSTRTSAPLLRSANSGAVMSRTSWFAQDAWTAGALGSLGKRIAAGVLLCAAVLLMWLHAMAQPRDYTLTVAVSDIAPSTVLAIPLGDEWVAQIFHQGVGTQWQSQAHSALGVMLSVSCPDQLCQLTLRHTLHARSHSHQDLVLSAASSEIWTAAIERLAGDFARCEANR